MNFWPIFKKEFKSYFYIPPLYIVFTIFLGLAGYFFYTDLLKFNTFNVKGTSSLMRGLWGYYFMDLRYILIFILPLLTMRLFAEEKKQGTLELLNVYPIRDWEIIFGKFVACLFVFLLMLFFTFINVLILGMIWGFSETYPLLAGYLGIFLLGCSLISCGVFISSLTENQIIAALGTLGIFIGLWFLTWNDMAGSEQTINLLRRLSLFDRVYYFFEGVIETKDVIFHVLFVSFFLFLTFCSLGSRRWRGKR